MQDLQYTRCVIEHIYTRSRAQIGGFRVVGRALNASRDSSTLYVCIQQIFCNYHLESTTSTNRSFITRHFLHEDPSSPPLPACRPPTLRIFCSTFHSVHVERPRKPNLPTRPQLHTPRPPAPAPTLSTPAKENLSSTRTQATLLLHPPRM